MRWLIFSLFLLFGAAPGLAHAQARPDIPLGPPVAGQWLIKASWTTSADPSLNNVAVCFKRVDTSEELGCASSPFPEPSSHTGEAVELLVTVVAPDPPADVCIRAYSVDAVGNKSFLSQNCAIADFTRPEPPEIL